MGLILGILAAIATLLMALLISLANGMSDAPSVQGTPVWPTLVIGGLISAVLILTHFFPLHW